MVGGCHHSSERSGGSSHDFDQFSLGKVGTGEGAQAYGHGLYFAGKKEVAQHYRDALSDGTTHYEIDGKPAFEGKPDQADPRQMAVYIRANGGKVSNQAAASKALHDAGIRGIKYLDGSSRSEGSGSHNYVIFNDKDVNVVNKYSRANDTGDAEGVPDQLPKGRLASVASRVADLVPGLRDVGDALQKGLAPMATGSVEARATAKDFANAMRRARYDGIHADSEIQRNFTREQ